MLSVSPPAIPVESSLASEVAKASEENPSTHPLAAPSPKGSGGGGAVTFFLVVVILGALPLAIWKALPMIRERFPSATHTKLATEMFDAEDTLKVYDDDEYDEERYDDEFGELGAGQRMSSGYRDNGYGDDGYGDDGYGDDRYEDDRNEKDRQRSSGYDDADERRESESYGGGFREIGADELPPDPVAERSPQPRSGGRSSCSSASWGGGSMNSGMD